MPLGIVKKVIRNAFNTAQSTPNAMNGFILIFIFFALFIYGSAFYCALKNRQSTIVYWVFLAIQIVSLILYWNEMIQPRSGGDAAGNGMARGIATMICIGVQVSGVLLVLLTLIVRHLTGKAGLSTVIISIIAVIVIFLLFTDFRYLFLSLTSGTDEQKLVQQNGVMYTTKGKPFTGKATQKGYIETYPREKTGWRQQDGEAVYTHKGLRTTHYKNGLKEGTEKLYYTNYIIIFADRTSLRSVSRYRNGVKNGEERIYYTGGKHLKTKDNYLNGKLHGLCRSFHYPDGFCAPLLATETQFDNGEISGFHRTFDNYGDTLENYTTINGRIIDGCRWIQETSEADTLEWYENGQLVIQRVFSHTPSRDSKNFNKEISEYPVDDLHSEIIYENGEIVSYFELNPDNGRAVIHKKRINGTLIEIFNRDANVDRRQEFGIE